jgi:GDP-4-dehydro-6-deoxy-D-mannose reductase
MAEERSMLLVGATGFVGAHLAEAAAGAGLRLIGVGREASDEAPGCDLLDPASVRACVAAVKPDLVVNAAGSASVGRSWEQPGETFAVNVGGALNLLEAVAQEAPAAYVLCLSSADVYGARDEGELPLAEELEPRPLTPYGAGKAAMEVLCGQYSRGRGMRIGVVRAFNMIGPGQSPRFAVPGFASRIARAEREGGEVELRLGNPAARRDFVDVRDGARALLELSRRELPGTYNLCSGRGTAIAELVAELARAARVPVTAVHDAELERPADPPALVGRPERLLESTGVVAEIELRQSLADLLEEWRARPAGA